MKVAGGTVCQVSLGADFRCYVRCEVRCYLFIKLSLFVLFNGDNSAERPFAFAQDEAFRFLFGFLGDGFNSIIVR